ncbi:hypothetical protein J1605_009633 [Eschrichtius robustus]|uniref:Staphylococcal nuclease domain-containing protein 1 n=1 Tax=Eschrichtius robustus TaxID=9764 RepID=A0AB34GWM4_ESCRO|nr:hypothetical protein J1605_009633 [Eschrichtius robustus]
MGLGSVLVRELFQFDLLSASREQVSPEPPEFSWDLLLLGLSTSDKARQMKEMVFSALSGVRPAWGRPSPAEANASALAVPGKCRVVEGAGLNPVESEEGASEGVVSQASLPAESGLRQVEVEVEGMDKAGNFIGWLHIDGANLSVLLVEHALSKVHFTAERSSYYKSLLSAEEAAKQKKEKVWAHYEEQPVEEVTPVLEEKERSASYKPVFVTEITDDLHFYVQDVETGTQLEKLMENMRNDIASHPPVEGSYAPRRGEFCIAKFVDGEWYRARVEKVESPAKVHVFYIDYGNREILPSSRLGTLPPAFSTRVLPAQATEYAFAFIQVPQDTPLKSVNRTWGPHGSWLALASHADRGVSLLQEDARTDAVDSVVRDIQNTQCLLNVEHLSAGCPHVTLQFADSKGDVGLGLVKEGLVMVEVRKEKQFQKVITEYLNAQESAKSARLNLWRYGDFRADDADEFGYSR